MKTNMRSEQTSITVDSKTLIELNKFKYEVQAKNLANAIQYLITHYKLTKKEAEDDKDKV